MSTVRLIANVEASRASTPATKLSRRRPESQVPPPPMTAPARDRLKPPPRTERSMRAAVAPTARRMPSSRRRTRTV